MKSVKKNIKTQVRNEFFVILKRFRKHVRKGGKNTNCRKKYQKRE